MAFALSDVSLVQAAIVATTALPVPAFAALAAVLATLTSLAVLIFLLRA